MVLATAALAASGCAQPGTQVSSKQAAELDVATERISVACGYAEELGAYGAPASPALAPIESIGLSGARKLAGVYSHDHTDIYQGESVGAIVQDSISLLGDCGLQKPRAVLVHALGGSS